MEVTYASSSGLKVPKRYLCFHYGDNQVNTVPVIDPVHDFLTPLAA